MKQFKFNNEVVILMGQSAQENWDLIDSSEQKWIWVHLKSFPSCHVVIQNNDLTNNDIILEASKICKEHTKYKNMKNLKISYCFIENLIKGEEKGSVYFKSNRKVQKLKL
jgi:hypothetical protein